MTPAALERDLHRRRADLLQRVQARIHHLRDQADALVDDRLGPDNDAFWHEIAKRAREALAAAGTRAVELGLPCPVSTAEMQRIAWGWAHDMRVAMRPRREDMRREARAALKEMHRDIKQAIALGTGAILAAIREEAEAGNACDVSEALERFSLDAEELVAMMPPLRTDEPQHAYVYKPNRSVLATLLEELTSAVAVFEVIDVPETLTVWLCHLDAERQGLARIVGHGPDCGLS